MNKRFDLFLLILLLFVEVFGVVNAKEVNKPYIDYSVINKAIVENIILPDYIELHKASMVLDKVLKRSCEHNEIAQQAGREGQEVSNYLLRTFLDLRYTWAKVQLISFGPISFLERRERFNFWPDKHRVGERQIRRLLNEAESKAQLKAPFKKLSIERFREKSVAVQGLSAMERILFSRKKILNNHDCALAELISTNLVGIAEEVSTQWSHKPIEFKNDLLNPVPDLTFFATPKEVTSVLLNDMSTQIRVVSDLKIANALPNAKKRRQIVNYRKLESWRSGNSFRLMRLNILSVKNYYHIGFSNQMKELNFKLHQQITSQFDHVLELLERFNLIKIADFKKQIEDPKSLKDLSSLQMEVLKLDQLLKQDVVKTFALNIKFNALDGD